MSIQVMLKFSIPIPTFLGHSPRNKPCAPMPKPYHLILSLSLGASHCWPAGTNWTLLGCEVGSTWSTHVLRSIWRSRGCIFAGCNTNIAVVRCTGQIFQRDLSQFSEIHVLSMRFKDADDDGRQSLEVLKTCDITKAWLRGLASVLL